MAAVGVHEQASEPYGEGRSFGEAGPATMRRLRLDHAVDPAAPANATIVDLDLAERGADGLVHFDHDVVVVAPADPAARNGWALVDVSNRGGPTASAYLQLDNTPAFPQPHQPPVGDGHLLAQGWTLVFAGWQFDIDVPELLGLRAPVARRDGGEIAGPVSYTFRASAPSHRLPLVLPGHRLWPPLPGTGVLEEDGVEVPADSWSFAERGNGRVVGLARPDGFTPGATYRCTYRTSGALVGGCGLLALRDVTSWLRDREGVARTLLFGVSQSGRLIRRFLHDGMNVDEAGAAAYDAVLPVIAGGRLGRFNDRFAVPGTLPSEPDQLTEQATYGALLARAGAPTKVMAMNSSNEYWRGDAALLHGDDHPDVRLHLVAGTQHATGYLPQLFELPAMGWKGRNGFNTIDYRPVLRALLAQVVDWVDHGVEPSPSTVPAEGELSTREAVLARFAATGRPTPRLDSFVQPAGPVPDVDATGNEIAGIRLPEVAAPVGVHTGWNLRHPDMGAPDDELFLVGSTWWFDEVPPLEEHLARTRAVLDDLVRRRLLLQVDVARLLTRAERAWQAASAGG